MTAPMPPSAAQIKAFVPSKYQQAIFDMIANPTGPQYVVVEAYAGSGKTTTLVKAATEYVDPKYTVLFCAFNKSIAREIGERTAGRSNVTASTLHSLGKRALDQHMGTRTQVDTRKQYKLVDRYIEAHYPGPDIVSHKTPNRTYYTAEGSLLQDAMLKLYDFTRLTLTDYNDPAALEAMAIHYDIDLDDRALEAVPQLIAWDEEMVRDQHQIDFTDMIYCPVKWGVTMQKFDWVFVDEAQDLNRCQLELSMMCRKPETGRMVFVGDRRQAIYGFAGADNRSVQNIIDRTKATTLPLSICYRCDLAMIKLAQEVTPQIEARPDAGPGEVIHIGADKFFLYVQTKDMVLCRLTAPLIGYCIDAIKRGIKARVEGRDLGKQLTAIVQKVAKRENFDYADFLQHLSVYRAQQVKMLRDKNADDTAVESMIDRCEAVGVVYESTDATNPDELCSEIDALFDEENPFIKFATIHRSKGLEADNVFIIAPDKLPLNLGGWQQEQEWNLRYVAVTRAKHKLYIVGGSFVPGPHAQNGPSKPQSHETSTPTADVPNLVTKGSTDSPSAQIAEHSARNIRRLEYELDRVAFKHHGDEPDFDIDALRRGDGPNFWGETKEEELDRVMRNTLAELKLQEREAEQISAEAANDAQQNPPRSRKDRERAELKRLFERKPETKRQREQKAIDNARAQFPDLPEDEAINAVSEKRVQDAQKGTQERRGPKHDVNPAGNSGGIKPREMVTQRRMFEATEKTELTEPTLKSIVDNLPSDDAALLGQLNNLPDITPPAKSSPLDELEKKIAALQDLGNRQDALEALEILRDIFG